MEMEVICISSDDESSLQKENIKNKSVVNFIEVVKSSNKVELLSSDEEKIEGNRKRKISQIKGEEIIHNNVEKKKKLDVNQDTSKITKRPIPESKLGFTSDVSKVYPVAESDCTTNKDQEVIIERPKLIVKEKKKISYITHDTFPLFISFCLQNARADEKKDMEKIVDKLKRHYDRLDPAYVSSKRFALFLNEKREAIMNNDQQKYMHITDVKNEMKRNSKKKPNSSEYDAVPSTSYAANNLKSNTIDSDYEEDIATNVNPKTKRKLKQVLHAMKKCEATIKKLDEAEVDFNEENDSSYIKTEKYKQRMVELYNKYCELTGDSTDAGRAYLRPKHLNPTGIVGVDHAITNFINSKITQRNKMKKMGALTDDLIFPDYRDILECVTRCNNTKNLNLDNRKQEQLAKKAFQQLGEHLQRSRQNDYWDTFSLYFENAKEDPATKDQALKKKLDNNRTEGNKRLTAVFEKYVKKQEEIKEQDSADETASEEEEEEEEEEDDEEGEEHIVDDEDKSQNNLPIINLSDEDNVIEKAVDKTIEDIGKTIKENKSSAEKDKNNINIVNQDMDNSNKTLADKSPEQCNEKVKIIFAKENAVSKNEILSDKVHKPCTDNNTVDSKKQRNLPASMANCTSNINRIEENLTEAVIQDASKVITDSMKETVTMGIADATTVDEQASTSKDAEVSGNGPDTMDDGKDVIDNEIEIMGNTTDATTKNVPSGNQSEEEKKPLLRVRSFAKPPTTWKDNQHNTFKTVQENSPKIINQKEVIDLTDETMTKPLPTKETKVKKSPIITKCAIKVGDKIIPVINKKTLIIPSKNLITVHNITSVQNITKNYLKVDKGTGQLISSVNNVPGSKIIRLPSVQVNANRQSQQQNANMVIATSRQEVPLRGNETIIQVVPSGKPILLPKKKTIQVTISKQNECSQATKPK